MSDVTIDPEHNYPVSDPMKPAPLHRSGDVSQLVQGRNKSVEFTPLKMLWHGDKVQDILDGKDIYPIQVELSLTMECNEKCLWCVDLPWRKAFAGTWDPDILMERMQEFYDLGTRSVTIEGGGEPTVHRQFERIVTGLKEIGFNMGLITNGVNMGRYAHLTPLFDWIRVSLDAYDEERHEYFKGLRAFEVIMRNLGKMVDAKQAAGADTVLGIGYLGVMKAMEVEPLAGLVQRLRDIGVNYIQFRRITEHESLDAGFVDLSDLLQYQTKEFKVYIHQMHEVITGNAGLPCLAHRFVAVVGGSGDMFFCCRLRTANNNFMGRIGNLQEQTVREVWHGEERRKMDEMMRDPVNTSSYCPECRHTKFNIVLDQVAKMEPTRGFI